MTDWRALCEELAEYLALLDEPPHEMVCRAQEALAQPEPEVAGPTEEELLELMPDDMRDEFSYAAKTCSDATGGQVRPRIFRVCLNTAALEYARAVLSRYGHQPAPPAEGEVGALVADLRMMASQAAEACQFTDAENLSRAADLLEQRHPAPVPVAERLPGPEDCDAEGFCWWWYPPVPEQNYGYWIYEDNAVPERSRLEWPDSWLPAHALPIPNEDPQP